jgi:hypothetical protein
MAQGERHRDGVGVPMDRQAIGGPDELGEEIVDVQFVEDNVEERAGPSQPARLVCDGSQGTRTLLLAPSVQFDLSSVGAVVIDNGSSGLSGLAHGTPPGEAVGSWEQRRKCAASRTARRTGPGTAPVAGLGERERRAGMCPHGGDHGQ